MSAHEAGSILLTCHLRILALMLGVLPHGHEMVATAPYVILAHHIMCRKKRTGFLIIFFFYHEAKSFLEPSSPFFFNLTKKAPLTRQSDMHTPNPEGLFYLIFFSLAHPGTCVKIFVLERIKPLEGRGELKILHFQLHLMLPFYCMVFALMPSVYSREKIQLKTLL